MQFCILCTACYSEAKDLIQELHTSILLPLFLSVWSQVISLLIQSCDRWELKQAANCY